MQNKQMTICEKISGLLAEDNPGPSEDNINCFDDNH